MSSQLRRGRRQERIGSDDETDEPSSSGNVRIIRKGSYKVRRNEKGETELHRACINGDYKAVERLLLKGHPINEKDNAGWTCLHEACNWGFTEIVRLLIEYGANIDAKGMGDLTPLLDAAANGQFENMNLLLTAGASISAKDSEGNTVLDLLTNYKNGAGTLSDDDEAEYERIVKLLEDRMKRDGIPLHRSTQSQKACPTGRRTKQSSNDIDPISLRTGASLYKSAISSVGRSAARKPGALFNYSSFTANRRTKACSASTSKKPALVTETEYKVCDDWMIDDLNGHYIRVDSKRSLSPDSRNSSPLEVDEFQHSPGGFDGLSNRVNVDDCFDPEIGSQSSHRLRRPAGSNTNADDIMLVDERPKKKRSPKKRLKQSRLVVTSPISPAAPNNDLFYDGTNDVMLDHVSGLTMSTAITVDQTPEVPQARFSNSDIVRVNVVVEGRKFAVILDNRYHTIEWLGEKVSSSYESATGKRAVIRLYTADDAALNASDTVEFLYHRNEELIGKIERLEVLPVEDNYRLICQRMKQEHYADICELLQAAGQTTILDFRHTCLRAVGGPTVLLKALQSSYMLTCLNLRGQKLSTADATELGRTLACLQSLSNLGIACTGIHCEQLLALSSELCRERDKRYALEKLDISYNALGDPSAAHLSRIVNRCPRLRFLKLQCIAVGANFIKDFKALLREAFSGIPLTFLDLSKNHLGEAVSDLQVIINDLDHYVELKLY